MCLLSSHQFISYPSPQPISSVHRLRCPTILKMSIIALIINIMPPPSSPQFSEFGRRLGSGRNFIEEVSSDEGFNIRAAVVASLEKSGLSRKPLLAFRMSAYHFCKLSLVKNPTVEVEKTEKDIEFEERGTLVLDGGSGNNYTTPIGVFGVPLEIIVQRQQSTRPVPQVLVRCADHLIISDWNAQLPDDVSAIDVATLIKCYLASLPEPPTTFALYDEIRDARSSIQDM